MAECEDALESQCSVKETLKWEVLSVKAKVTKNSVDRTCGLCEWTLTFESWSLYPLSNKSFKTISDTIHQRPTRDKIRVQFCAVFHESQRCIYEFHFMRHPRLNKHVTWRIKRLEFRDKLSSVEASKVSQTKRHRMTSMELQGVGVNPNPSRAVLLFCREIYLSDRINSQD